MGADADFENARQGTRWGVRWWLAAALLFVALWLVLGLAGTVGNVAALQPWAGVAGLLAVVSLVAAGVQWLRRGR